MVMGLAVNPKTGIEQGVDRMACYGEDGFVRRGGLYVPDDSERPGYLVEGFKHVADLFRETRKRPRCHGIFMVFGDHDTVEDLSDYLNGGSKGSAIIREIVKKYGEKGLLYNRDAMTELLDRLCFFDRGDIDGAFVLDEDGTPHLDNEHQEYGMRHIYHSRRFKIPTETTLKIKSMKGADIGTKARVATCASMDGMPCVVGAEATRAVITFMDGRPLSDLYLEPHESHLDDHQE